MREEEQAKYESMWSHDSYRRNAPGEGLVEDAISRLGMGFGSSVLDFGCGTGRAAQKFKDLDFRVIGLDFAENCLDKGVDIMFLQRCLWEPLGVDAEYGFCTDVMEHIPPEFVDETLSNIAESVEYGCYFQIATRPDAMGKLIGKKLHLTVKNSEWWTDKLAKHFNSVDVVKATNKNYIAIGRK